jgi:CRISPR-associated endonuclease Cas3-HD
LSLFAGLKPLFCGGFFMLFARSLPDLPEERWPTLKEHLEEVAKLCREFATVFESGDYGEVVGFLHDVGKASKKFQKKLHGDKIDVDHSTAGGREALKLAEECGQLAGIIAAVIAGHHGGIPHVGKFIHSRSKKPLDDYSAWEKEVT